MHYNTVIGMIHTNVSFFDVTVPIENDEKVNNLI